MVNFLSEFVISVLTSIIVGVILSYPVMLLWNLALVPAVSGVSPVGWMQAWGLMIMIGFFRSKLYT